MGIRSDCFVTIHLKNSFAKRSKILAGYRSEKYNNFVDYQNNYVECSNQLLEYKNFLQHCSLFSIF